MAMYSKGMVDLIEAAPTGDFGGSIGVVKNSYVVWTNGNQTKLLIGVLNEKNKVITSITLDSDRIRINIPCPEGDKIVDIVDEDYVIIALQSEIDLLFKR